MSCGDGREIAGKAAVTLSGVPVRTLHSLIHISVIQGFICPRDFLFPGHTEIVVWLGLETVSGKAPSQDHALE